MKSFLHNKLSPFWWAGVVAVCLVAGMCSFFINGNAVTYIDDAAIAADLMPADSADEAMQLLHSNEYKSWKNTADTSFSSLFNGNQAVDVLEKHPARVIMPSAKFPAENAICPISEKRWKDTTAIIFKARWQ